MLILEGNLYRIIFIIDAGLDTFFLDMHFYSNTFCVFLGHNYNFIGILVGIFDRHKHPGLTYYEFNNKIIITKKKKTIVLITLYQLFK